MSLGCVIVLSSSRVSRFPCLSVHGSWGRHSYVREVCSLVLHVPTATIKSQVGVGGATDSPLIPVAGYVCGLQWPYDGYGDLRGWLLEHQLALFLLRKIGHDLALMLGGTGQYRLGSWP